MIPRYQQVLFGVFLAASLLMGAALWHLRRSTQDRLSASMADAPLVASSQVALAPIKLLLASDVDDTLRMTEKKLPAPDLPNARARFVLQALMSEYASPLSQHPMAVRNAVEDVFLLPLDIPAIPAAAGAKNSQVAIVNLDRAFTEGHPIGLATEMLTVRSIVGTLHANLPEILAVRFLVDGQPAESFAGHADLKHIYSATEERQIAEDARSGERP